MSWASVTCDWHHRVPQRAANIPYYFSICILSDDRKKLNVSWSDLGAARAPVIDVMMFSSQM